MNMLTLVAAVVTESITITLNTWLLLTLAFLLDLVTLTVLFVAVAT